jgi:hypothetical protein
VKYVYGGKYIQVMGRMFAFGKPVEVSDEATQRILDERPDFRRVEDAVRKEEGQRQEAVLSDECPKCHKIVKRGKFMHQKYCQGEQ